VTTSIARWRSRARAARHRVERALRAGAREPPRRLPRREGAPEQQLSEDHARSRGVPRRGSTADRSRARGERLLRRVRALVERTLDAMAPVVERGEGAAKKRSRTSPRLRRRWRERAPRRRPPPEDALRSTRSPLTLPHAAVAIGLAIASDSAAGFELDDRFSRNFGVFREAQHGERASYDPIFTREMALPRPGQPPSPSSAATDPRTTSGTFASSSARTSTPQAIHRHPRADHRAPLPVRSRPARRRHRPRAAPVRRLDREGPLTRERYAFARRACARDHHGPRSGFERTAVIGAA